MENEKSDKKKEVKLKCNFLPPKQDLPPLSEEKVSQLSFFNFENLFFFEKSINRNKRKKVLQNLPQILQQKIQPSKQNNHSKR